MNGDAHIEFFDGPDHFTRRVESLPECSKELHGNDRNSDWCGGTYAQAIHGIKNGSESGLLVAQKFIGKIGEIEHASSDSVWGTSVSGYFPCVPAYISGGPENMFRREQIKTNLAPMKIVASCCFSSGQSSSEIEARGASILALTMLLSSVRPIELYAYADLGMQYSNDEFAAIPVVKIQAYPLDIASASFILTSSMFLRRLCFRYAHQWGFDGGWAWGGNPTNDRQMKLTKKALSISEEDLWLPSMMCDNNMTRNPEKWLKDNLEKFSNRELA